MVTSLEEITVNPAWPVIKSNRKDASNPRRVAARRWFSQPETWLRCGPPPIDFQMHSTWSDGHSAPKALIETAKRNGLRAIAITEHVNAETTWYHQFSAELERLRDGEETLEVYKGAEIAVGSDDGTLKADPHLLNVELILGVVHRYPKKGGGFWNFKDLNSQDAIELELRALEKLASRGEVDAIGHPGGTAYRKFGPFPVSWLEPAFRAAKANGIAVELNTSYLWDLEGLWALLCRVNPLLSFGSDAHEATDTGSNFERLRNLPPFKPENDDECLPSSSPESAALWGKV